MEVALFCHSVRSDWNNGNAHFLRGVVAELQRRGHGVHVHEPAGGWSAANLVGDFGPDALGRYLEAYPTLDVRPYVGDGPDLERSLDRADLVLVHEWTPPALVAEIGRMRQQGRRFSLFFHDTHHRAVTRTDEIGGLDLDGYDGVLAFGEAVSERYRAAGWGRRVWTWHEAADTHIFRPLRHDGPQQDVVWVGNWGDEERSEELRMFLLRPATRLGLQGHVYGVRYPDDGLRAVADARLTFGGHLANHRVPQVFAAHRATVHVPRRPYAEHLPGVPTIRVFEALACGIPLVSAPWADTEGLFEPGDYLVAKNEEEMVRHLRDLREDPALAAATAAQGLARVLARHTCAHRVDELLALVRSVRAGWGDPKGSPLPIASPAVVRGADPSGSLAAIRGDALTGSPGPVRRGNPSGSPAAASDPA